MNFFRKSKENLGIFSASMRPMLILLVYKCQIFVDILFCTMRVMHQGNAQVYHALKNSKSCCLKLS